jgi:hypothetical protein
MTSCPSSTPTRARLAHVLAMMIAALPVMVRAADAPGDPDRQVQQLMADGKQPEAIRLIDQQLLQRGLDQKGPERYRLLMLKGDAMIQSKRASMASSVFDQAGRAAPDGQAAAVARAHVLLLRAAPTNKYTPRSGGEPIDITNPDSRRAAFDALRADMLATAKPKIARAAQGRSLNPALDLLPTVLDMASLEVASKGSMDETKADVSSASEHAQDLMRGQITAAQRRINSLGDRAFTIEEGDRRFLTSSEAKDLPPIIAEMRKIEKVARDVRRRAQELGNPATAWDQIALEAADAADAAERVAEAGAASTRN